MRTCRSAALVFLLFVPEFAGRVSADESISQLVSRSVERPQANAISDGAHLSMLPWWKHPDFATGYVKLVTPIIATEQNMFSIKIFGYRFEMGNDALDIRCGGDAYVRDGRGLYNPNCSVYGTDLSIQ